MTIAWGKKNFTNCSGLLIAVVYPMPSFPLSQKSDAPDDVEVPVEKEAFMDEFFGQVRPIVDQTIASDFKGKS